MPRAIAIAAVQQNSQSDPFTSAARSAVNSLHAVFDFMYGTPQRARMTCLFALGLALLGSVLQVTGTAMLQSCPA